MWIKFCIEISINLLENLKRGWIRTRVFFIFFKIAWVGWDQFFDHIKGTSYDFLKPYSESGDKTESDAH